MAQSALTIGTDTEYFLTKNNSITHAIGVIKGTKEKPRKFAKLGNLHEDNVLAEIVTEPHTSRWDFLDNVRGLQAKLKEVVALRGYGVSDVASHIFTRPQLRKMPAQAMQFGCAPDFNIYTGEANPPPDSSTTLRTAAGHVHFGPWNAKSDAIPNMIVCLDYLLGLWAVINDPDITRRNLYGTAGSYRPKPYGAEYRVLSNFWTLSGENINYVFSSTMAAMQSHASILQICEVILPTEDLRDIINEHKRNEALIAYKQIHEKIYNEYIARA